MYYIPFEVSMTVSNYCSYILKEMFEFEFIAKFIKDVQSAQL